MFIVLKYFSFKRRWNNKLHFNAINIGYVMLDIVYKYGFIFPFPLPLNVKKYGDDYTDSFCTDLIQYFVIETHFLDLLNINSNFV